MQGMLRFRITPDGDLQMFGLGLDRMPAQWREDPKWRGPAGAGRPGSTVPSHKVLYPSRWVPVLPGNIVGMLRRAPTPEQSVRLIDFLVVPKERVADVPSVDASVADANIDEDGDGNEDSDVAVGGHHT